MLEQEKFIMKNELILFETADKEIKLNVSVKDSTV